MNDDFYENLKKDAYFNEIKNRKLKEPLEDYIQLEYEIIEAKHGDGNYRDKLMLLRIYQEAIARFYDISNEELVELRENARKKYSQDVKKKAEESSSKGIK